MQNQRRKKQKELWLWTRALSQDKEQHRVTHFVWEGEGGWGSGKGRWGSGNEGGEEGY